MKRVTRVPEHGARLSKTGALTLYDIECQRAGFWWYVQSVQYTYRKFGVVRIRRLFMCYSDVRTKYRTARAVGTSRPWSVLSPYICCSFVIGPISHCLLIWDTFMKPNSIHSCVSCDCLFVHSWCYCYSSCYHWSCVPHCSCSSLILCLFWF